MTKAPEVNSAPNPFDPTLQSDHRQDLVRVHRNCV
jgi:hypothetical protein